MTRWTPAQYGRAADVAIRLCCLGLLLMLVGAALVDGPLDLLGQVLIFTGAVGSPVAAGLAFGWVR